MMLMAFFEQLLGYILLVEVWFYIGVILLIICSITILFERIRAGEEINKLSSCGLIITGMGFSSFMIMNLVMNSEINNLKAVNPNHQDVISYDTALIRGDLKSIQLLRNKWKNPAEERDIKNLWIYMNRLPDTADLKGKVKDVLTAKLIARSDLEHLTALIEARAF